MQEAGFLCSTCVFRRIINLLPKLPDHSARQHLET
jgi:hypothetical protein